MTKSEAEVIAGKLSKPSKMPGYAYGLPVRACPVGSLLMKVNGSVCAHCYAARGRYVFKNVKDAQERRLASLRHPQWVDAMVALIRAHDCMYFRWHDSGDIQGLWHLAQIVEVARRCPDVKFWLPTRERFVVNLFTRDNDVPDNLIIRVSATMVDAGPPAGFAHTSTVVRGGAHTCPADKQDNQCGACRACWDRDVKNVAYKKH